MFDSYSILEILAGDVCFVNLFRSILPVEPTECDVLIVCRQHNDKEWKFKEQHAKVWENIAGGEKILSPPWFQHCGGKRPHRPRRSDASAKRPPPCVSCVLLSGVNASSRLGNEPCEPTVRLPD